MPGISASQLYKKYPYPDHYPSPHPKNVMMHGRGPAFWSPRIFWNPQHQQAMFGWKGRSKRNKGNQHQQVSIRWVTECSKWLDKAKKVLIMGWCNKICIREEAINNVVLWHFVQKAFSLGGLASLHSRIKHFQEPGYLIVLWNVLKSFNMS